MYNHRIATLELNLFCKITFSWRFISQPTDCFFPPVCFLLSMFSLSLFTTFFLQYIPSSACPLFFCSQYISFFIYSLFLACSLLFPYSMFLSQLVYCFFFLVYFSPICFLNRFVNYFIVFYRNGDINLICRLLYLKCLK